MIQIVDKNTCCGCTSCYNACPKGAIQMESDEEGFLYPKVDLELCVECGLCEKKCPIQKAPKSDSEERLSDVQGYIVRYNNPLIVEESTSGGVFTAVAKYIISKGGIVYGTGYDTSMKVICKKAASLEDLSEMRGSKFVQSELGRTFTMIKSELDKGELILFSGTPCQVSGLKAYLGKQYNNLVCIDFVCRGVPSPGLWKNYVNYMEKKHNSRMVNARFKHKTYGYHTTTMRIEFENGEIYKGSGRVDPYMKAFVTEMSSRPSCSDCSFKGIERVSDLTMFDCYKFSEITGIKDDDKGYSSMFIQSRVGMEVFEAIKDELDIFSVEVDTLVEKNGIMVNHSAKPHNSRDYFYKLAMDMPIDMAMENVNPIRISDYIIEHTKELIYDIGLIKIVRKIMKPRNVQIK